MSIISRCSRDSITIKREEVVAGNEEAIRTWTTEARTSSFPTEMTCCVQDNPIEESQMLGVRAEIRVYRIYTSDNPYIDTRDHVFVTDTEGIERECFVIKPSFSFDGSRARLWKTIVADYLATEE